MATSMVDSASRSDRRAVGWDGPLVAFFVIAYGLAWGIWLLEMRLAAAAGMDNGDFLRAVEDGDFAAITSGPPSWLLYLITRVQDYSFTIAGVVMISITAGADGWRRLGSRLTAWRLPLRWYAAGLLPVVVYGAAALIASNREGGAAVIGLDTLNTILFSLSAGLLVSLFLRGAMGEELGLRGFALPRLQQRMTPARASLIIGVFWALWHLPALIGGNEPAAVVILLILIVGLTFIFTALFNGGGGSLIPPLLFHATQNWEEGFETIFPDIVDTDWETPAALTLLLLAGVAVVMVKRQSAGSGGIGPEG